MVPTESYPRGMVSTGVPYMFSFLKFRSMRSINLSTATTGYNYKYMSEVRIKRGRELSQSRGLASSWLAFLNAFPTLSCILFKLKQSWNTHSCIYFVKLELEMFPVIEYVTVNSHQLLSHQLLELNRQIPYKLTSVQILKMQNGHQLKSSQHYAKCFDRL